MRVLLLQLDGKLPNVALMRLAAHHRDLGDEVLFRNARKVDTVRPELGERADRVYASAIFDSSRPIAEEVLRAWPGAVVGGTGWDLRRTVEDLGVRTRRQDYSIYPRFRASIGFSHRGCRLSCPFCVVPKAEGAVRPEQTIAELWRGPPWPKDILLLDNDFFGQPGWRDRVEELRSGGYKVSFSQGINVRAIGPEEAAAVASLEYRDDGFRGRRVYTAWDSRKDEARLVRGLRLLFDAGVKPDHVLVYMLVGYWPGETHEDRDYRRRVLRELGTRPYPMPFVRTPELVGFQRWVVQAWDKRVSWGEWCASRLQPRNAWRRQEEGRTPRLLPIVS